MTKRNQSRTVKLLGRLLKYWEVRVILSIVATALVIAAPQHFYASYQAQENQQRTRLEQDVSQLLQQLVSEEQESKNPINPSSSLVPNSALTQPSSFSCASNPQLTILAQVTRKPEVIALAAATNRGEREKVDRTPQKNPVLHTPQVIVVHETVIPLDETLRLFQTSNENDSAQLSYHVLIALNGDRYRVVPDQERAFGAGNSDFEITGLDGRRQSIAVALNPNLPSSINNVALHVSLETPADGNREVPTHSGYTEEQYAALAKVVGDWMIQYRLSGDRITTHKVVDRDRRKQDPRSFNNDKFTAYLQSYLQSGSCTPT